MNDLTSSDRKEVLHGLFLACVFIAFFLSLACPLYYYQSKVLDMRMIELQIQLEQTKAASKSAK